MQKRTQDDGSREVADRLARCEAFISEVYARVQDVRNNVEEQSQFAKSEEVRAQSEEFIILADSLLDFLGEGVRGLMENTGGEGGGGGEKEYDPSNPTVEAAAEGGAQGDTPMAIDSASPAQPDLSAYVTDFYNRLYAETNGGIANTSTNDTNNNNINPYNPYYNNNFTNVAMPGYENAQTANYENLQTTNYQNAQTTSYENAQTTSQPNSLNSSHSSLNDLRISENSDYKHRSLFIF